MLPTDSSHELPDVPRLADSHLGLARSLKLAFDLRRRTYEQIEDELDQEHLEGVILGDFKILREIGRGGMGFVFEAIQLSLNRHVALKILPVKSASKKQHLDRFEREAQAAASLEHPNIVRAYTRGEDQGIYYLAMQFVSGMDLSEFISERRFEYCVQNGSVIPENEPTAALENEIPFEDTVEASHELALVTESSSVNADYYRRVARFGMQAAQAIQYAHEQGVVHRDIKPSNLLLDESENVWVTDFGLAVIEAANKVTATGNVIGTLRYASPEQARGDTNVDHRTDIYSLGATLYELATLRPPFTEEEPAALLNRVLYDEPERPRKVAKSIPKSLDSIIQKAIARESRNRYQTALELAVDLQRFLRNEPVLAKQPSWFEKGYWWLWTHRANVALVILTLLMAVMLGLLLKERASRGRVSTKFSDQLIESNDKLSTAINELRQREKAEFEARQRSSQTEYISRLSNLAYLAHAGNYAEVNSRLQALWSYARDHQIPIGFVWQYLNGMCSSGIETAFDFNHQLLSSDLASKRGLHAAGGNNGTIYISDVDTWRMVTSLYFPREVQSVQFSPDERYLAAAGSDGEVRLFETTDWTLLNVFRGFEMTVKSVVFTPDSQRVIAGCRDGRIKVWDVASHRLLNEFEAHDVVQHLSIGDQGNRLTSAGSDGRIRSWDLQTFEMLADFHGHDSTILVSASSFRRPLVASGGYDHYFCIWDTENQTQLASVLIDAQVWSLRFFDRGDKLAVGTNHGEIRIYDMRVPEDPTLLRRMRAHESSIRGMLFADGGTRMVSVGEDGWQRVVNYPLHRIETTRRVGRARSLAISPDGNQIGIGLTKGRSAIYSRSGQEIKGVNSSATITPGVGFDKDKSFAHVVIEHGIVTLHRRTLEDKETTQTFGGQRDNWTNVWLGDRGETVIAVDDQRTVFIWDTATQELLWEERSVHSIAAVQVANDQGWMAYSDSEGHVFVARKGQSCFPLSPVSPAGNYALAFDSTNQFLAAGGFEGRVYLWDLDTLEHVRSLPQESYITCLAFSQDGRYLAVGSSSLDLWDVYGGRKILQLADERQDGLRFEAVTFSEADDCLVALSDKPSRSVLHIWDIHRWNHRAPNVSQANPPSK